MILCMSLKSVRWLIHFNENLEKGSLGTKESHKKDVDYFTILKAWVNECDCYIGEPFCTRRATVS